MTELSTDEIAELRQVGPGPVGDALLRLGVRDFVVGGSVRPIHCPRTICGPAVTLKQVPTRGRKGASKHIDVLYEAQAGDVVVIDTFGRHDVIIMGGRGALIAKLRGLEAMVIDGAIRDRGEIIAVDVPFFASAELASTARVADVLETQAIDVPIACGGVLVNPRDLILAGTEGMIVVPREHAHDALAIARELDAEDKRQLEAIRAGRPRDEWYR